MEPLDVRCLVIYKGPPRHGQVEIVGVREFHIAKALMEGHQEELSELLPSQWGMVHLFDLCLWFGHVDTASALAMRGVPGCFLDDHHHLGPFSSKDSWGLARPCGCHGWDTCPYCCWAFPVNQGIWMEDWDHDLFDYDSDDDDDVSTLGAIPAAQKAAATPITRAMLELSSSDMELPFSGSPKAMARLLDIAILAGNQEANVNLAKKCQLRPLRRWVLEWGLEECWEAAKTALLAGADFQDLMVENFFGSKETVPFPQALFLKSFEDWKEVRHLLPRCHDLWRPRNWDNHFAEFFLERPDGPGVGWKLSAEKIRAAEDAGLELQYLFLEVGAARFVTLLDMAILCGQPDCVEACVDGGIELKGDDRPLAWHKQVLLGESLGEDWDGPPLNIVPSQAKIAAAAAGRAWLRRCWKSEASQKGVVLYQMMLKMLKGKSFPMLLAQEILSYSMPVPKIMDQLDLWEHVGDWMATTCGRPAFVLAAADCNAANVEKPQGVQDNHEASDNGEAGSSVSPLTAPAETVHGNVKTNDDLMMALHASRDQVPALNFHGVCVFRLTRLATSAHVSDLLLNPSGPLASLHNRVLEAGCQVDPEWNPVKVIFIPITEDQKDELICLAEQGYEFNKEDHILALQEDETIITEALRSHLCKRYRPALKKVGPEFQPDEDVQMEENDPLLVRETGLRTDSSVGFPSYS